MSLFQLLNPLPVKLIAVNIPARKKGPEIIHTTDVVLEFEGSNALLDYFDPELRPMLYRALREGEKAQQDQLPGVDIVSDMPILRTTALRVPIALSLEFAGYTMELDRGRGTKDSNISADEIEVKRIRIWPKEGGSVRGQMHLQSRHMSGAEVGQLRDMLKLETTVILRAPPLQTEIQPETEKRGATSPVPKAARGSTAPAAGKTATKTIPKATKKPTKEDTAAAATEAFQKLHAQQAGAAGAPPSVQ